jgi:drug/metabolite transporter (DMT)-like permease
MRVGDVSVVAPFRYTRLVFALFLGITVFGERPDIWMLVGSAIVIGSGTFTMLRSKPRT